MNDDYPKRNFGPFVKISPVLLVSFTQRLSLLGIIGPRGYMNPRSGRGVSQFIAF